MFECEDSDVEDGQDLVQPKTKNDKFSFIHVEPPDILYKRWGKIKLEQRREAGHLLHISVFWWHILYKQQDSHITTDWAVDVGFLDA
ncbi:E3 ubiquitin-protein ligase TTC3 isoform X1, partial [Tachysurus ichikawai]